MALRLSQLKKQFISPDGAAVPVIDVELFDLGRAEQVALVGGSGTGKTTLLHLIAGILAPDSGRITFDFDSGGFPALWSGDSESKEQIGGASSAATAAPGASVLAYRDPATVRASASVTDITALSEANRDVFRGRFIGYIFQTHHLLPGFTAMENVLLGMSFSGRRPDKAWATRLLEEVGLGQRLDYKPAKLSVGQQQRIAVARALANRPKLVLADEPTGALDPKTAQQVLELIRKLCTEVGASLLLVSHDPQISAQFSRVVALAELNRAST